MSLWSLEFACIT